MIGLLSRVVGVTVGSIVLLAFLLLAIAILGPIALAISVAVVLFKLAFPV